MTDRQTNRQRQRQREKERINYNVTCVVTELFFPKVLTSDT